MSSQSFNIRCPKLPGTVQGLKQLGHRAPHIVARSIKEWAESTRTAAMRVTPKKLGVLRNSLYVKQKGTATIIGAGGAAEPYAKSVHENLRSGVKWTTPGTGPKFLENPIRERMPVLGRALKKDIDEELERFR